jgi:hypothetical protein
LQKKVSIIEQLSGDWTNRYPILFFDPHAGKKAARPKDYPSNPGF